MALVIKRHISQPQANPPPAQIALGARIEVPNVDWQKNEKTLVFFLKKDCVYCSHSAPFLRQLIADASEQNVKVLALLPDSLEESRRYVDTLGLAIDQV